ncbi:hypothetical protein F5884DRAFT_56988 [Xylogone sp. PMI_703]|nr:hypothetical protein F5884DRAFT_56988 [Xylogone sp. PMI_703]
MPSAYESVAIAQVMFYVPVIPITICILVKNWSIGARISRLSWFTLTILSLVRYIGGILVIVKKSHPDNAGLTIATVVLLNVGLVPLIMSTLGMIGVVLSLNNEKYYFINKTMIIVRLLFVTAFTLFAVGRAISLDGHSTSDNLVKAGYILFIATVVVIIANCLYIRCQKSKLEPRSDIYLRGVTFAIPFLILRAVYGVLSAFLTPYTWSPLDGSAVAFALMALLPEYVTILIYAYLGFHRFRENSVSSTEPLDNRGDQLPKYAPAQLSDLGRGERVGHLDYRR